MQSSANAENVRSAEVSFSEELLWQEEVGAPTASPFLDCARNLSLALRLRGPLKEEALKVSLSAVVQRQDVIRSKFALLDGQLVRLTSQPLACNFTVIDRRSLPREDPHGILQNEIKLQLARPFDLAHGPLLRAVLAPLTDDDHILAISVHHIVFDRWSRRLLELELKQFYNAYSSGSVIDVRPLHASYHDYVSRQREQLSSDRSRQLSEYWINRLSGLPQLILASNSACGRGASARSGTRFTISVDEVSRLAALSRQSRTTLATTMLAIFKLFLYRIAGADDVAVGVPISDRRRPEFEHVIGLFMNVVVVRTSITNRLTFLDLVDRVRLGLVDACLHQDLPYGYLLRIIGTRPPYRVLFNFMPNLSVLECALGGGLQSEPVPIHMEPQSLADLSFQISSSSGALSCRLVYKGDLFSPACGQAFAMQIQMLIKAVLDAPRSCVDSYSIG